MKQHKILKICVLIALLLSLSSCNPFILVSIHPIAPVEYKVLHARAEHNDPEAQFEVAEKLRWACHQWCCFDSLAWKTQCDKPECKKWYLLAAENGSAAAQAELGNLYSTGGYCEIEKNDTEAMKWRLKAADQGYVPAYLDLAEFYAKGIKTKQDYTEAARWYEKAAEKGDSYAQFVLSKMYADGRAVPKDILKAIEWGVKAAQQGEINRRYELAILYTKTDPPDYEEAYYWASIEAALYKKHYEAGPGNPTLERYESAIQEFEKHLTREKLLLVKERINKELTRLCTEKEGHCFYDDPE